MAVPGPVALALAAQAAVAAVSFAAALLLLGWRFNDPAHRAFALLFALLGMGSVSGLLGSAPEEAGPAGTWARLGPYFGLPAPFVLLAAFWLYPAPRRGPPWDKAVPLLLGAGAVAALALYLADHGLWSRGPLQIVAAAGGFLLAPLALVLARDAARAPGGQRARVALVAAGLAMAPVHAVATTLPFVVFQTIALDGLGAAELALVLGLVGFQLAFVAAAAAHLLLGARREPIELRRPLRRAAALLLLPAATGLLGLGAIAMRPEPDTLEATQAVGIAWFAALPACVALALAPARPERPRGPARISLEAPLPAKVPEPGKA